MIECQGPLSLFLCVTVVSRVVSLMFWHRGRSEAQECWSDRKGRVNSISLALCYSLHRIKTNTQCILYWGVGLH